MKLIKKYKERISSSIDSKTDENLFDEAEREYFRENDPRDNELSSPPEDVKVYIPSIWVFEAFTPSFIQNLNIGFEILGLKEKMERYNRINIDEEILSMRSRDKTVLWRRIGKFSTNNISPSRRLKLPGDILSVSIYLHQFIPSTTILAIQFQFKDSLRDSIDKTLRMNFETKAVKKDRTISYYSPIQQKREAYQYYIENLKSICTNWLVDYFPGLFASNLIERGHPTVELILLKNADPINVGEHRYESYLNTLGFRSEFETYNPLGIENLYMTLRGKIIDTRSTMVLSADMDKLLSFEESKKYGDDLLFGISNWLEGRFNKTLAFWCLTEIAFSLEQQLMIMRDKIGSTDISNPKKALSELQEIEAELSSVQLNAIPFSHEVLGFTDLKDFESGVYDFEIVTDKIDSKFTFNEFRRKKLSGRVKSIQDLNQQINSVIGRLTDLVSSQINFNLSETNQNIQKWLVALTVIAVIIAAFNFFDITVSSIINIFRSG